MVISGRIMLSETQQQIVDKIIESFKKVDLPWVNPNSDLCSKKEFVEYFSNLFAVYHSITEHKFEKKSFEFAFKYASIAAGSSCDITSNTSHQGEDVVLNGVGISLKTEGERNETKLTISKFSEARFIARCKTEVEERTIRALSDSDYTKEERLGALLERRETSLREELASNFLSTFSHHINSYERIIVLKANKSVEQDESVEFYRYRLIEIPKALLLQAESLKPSDFAPVRGNGGSSAKVVKDDKRLFDVILDGSVEKISIRNIAIDECITHADFHVNVTV